MYVGTEISSLDGVFPRWPGGSQVLGQHMVDSLI